MVANNFYPLFSMNKSHRLDKNDSKELLLSFTHYNSKTGFMCDIEQDIEPRLIRKIQCTTLIIHSRNDNSVSFEHAEYASKKIKGSTLIGLDNEWGHLFWIGKDSTELIKNIIEFIER